MRAAVVVVTLFSGGCAALPLAALGTVADISASVIGTGSEVFSLGKLDSVEYATLAQSEYAVRQSIEQLQFRLVKDEFDNNHEKYTIADVSGNETSIEADLITPCVCAFRINVGLFGSEPLARLLLLRIRAHLPLEPARPTTQRANVSEFGDLPEKADT